MNQNTATKSARKSARKASHELWTEDGFYSCGTLAECAKRADRFAADGVQAFVYAAGELDTVVYDPCAE